MGGGDGGRLLGHQTSQTSQAEEAQPAGIEAAFIASGPGGTHVAGRAGGRSGSRGHGRTGAGRSVGAGRGASPGRLSKHLPAAGDDGQAQAEESGGHELARGGHWVFNLDWDATISNWPRKRGT